MRHLIYSGGATYTILGSGFFCCYIIIYFIFRFCRIKGVCAEVDFVNQVQWRIRVCVGGGGGWSLEPPFSQRYFFFMGNSKEIRVNLMTMAIKGYTT